MSADLPEVPPMDGAIERLAAEYAEAVRSARSLSISGWSPAVDVMRAEIAARPGRALAALWAAVVAYGDRRAEEARGELLADVEARLEALAADWPIGAEYGLGYKGGLERAAEMCAALLHPPRGAIRRTRKPTRKEKSHADA